MKRSLHSGSLFNTNITKKTAWKEKKDKKWKTIYKKNFGQAVAMYKDCVNLS